jgi:phosphoenolpyruvate---glycerone phosphotransferase subunit DhaM
MVGVVVVSHSEPLAEAAVHLALQMVGDHPPPIEVAAGSAGGLGTDAVAVAAAIERADRASGGTGVLVLTDLGSAILSAEMALELTGELTGKVLLSRAPFVEGLVAAVVQAGTGRSLVDVEREAVGAAQSKATQLGAGDDAEPSPPNESAESTPEVVDADVTTLDVEIVNPQGLHARPAAVFAKAAADLPVDVTVTNLESGQGPADAESMMELMTLGVRLGHRVRLAAAGPQAQAALDTLAGLIADGLGEGVAEGSEP